jgi:uroporphyrinogen III methyltransferase/synthase
LTEHDWIVFSSANGARFFLERLRAVEGSVDRLAGARLAAIGPGTAEQLARYKLHAHLVPDEYRAEALAEALINSFARQVRGPSPEAVTGQPQYSAKPARSVRFLLIRGSRGREVLAERLLAAGAQVEQVVAYRSIDVAEPVPHVRASLAAGRIHWTMVTSSAIARSLVRMFGPELHHTKLASISPLTSATLRELGYLPAAEAEQYTIGGVMAAMVRHEQLCAEDR